MRQLRRPRYRLHPTSFQLFPPSSLQTIGLMIPLSGIGALIRKALGLIPTSLPRHIIVAIAPQVVGCAFMGLLMNKREKMNKAVFSALTVGFCGSVTSFSSWMVATFSLLVGEYLPVWDSILYSILLVFSVLSVSYTSYIFGTHLSRIRNPVWFRTPRRIQLLQQLQPSRWSFVTTRSPEPHPAPMIATPTENTTAQGEMLPLPLPDEAHAHDESPQSASLPAFPGAARPLATSALLVEGESVEARPSWSGVTPRVLVLVLVMAYLLAAILLLVFIPHIHDWATVALFAPLGATLRWLVCWHLNWYPTVLGEQTPYKLRRLFRIPFGTMLVNVTGSALLSLVYHVEANREAIAIQDGLADGFLGTLTTVSSMIAELIALPRPSQKYTYFALSWGASWLLMLAAPPVNRRVFAL